MESRLENWESVKEYERKIMGENRNFTMGSYYTEMVKLDLKHLIFTLSRYKFVSKLLMYKKDLNIIELGCNEAMGAELFDQELSLKQYIGIDFDKEATAWNRETLNGRFRFIESDFFEEIVEYKGRMDAVVSLDVIEHIEKNKENDFFRTICYYLGDNGVAVIGTPNIMMEKYQSESSRMAHINLYDQKRFFQLASQYFNNVFIFNMNDEVVNMGFSPMACYFFGLCVGKRIV